MTRTECENLIIEKLEEIVAIYKEYNPEGNYLSLAMVENTIWAFNNRWDEDINKPIDITKIQDKEQETESDNPYQE